MYNVNFKTEQALYDKFRIINTIKKEKHQNVLTNLIKNYVNENERFIENPEIQEEIQHTVPEFYAKPVDCALYVRKLSKKGFEEMATRVTFWRFLLHEHAINKDDGSRELEFILKNKELFQKSEDYEFLSNGIFNVVQERNPIL